MNETILGEDYLYKTLEDPRHIRLITLLRGANEDPIALAIEHASLDENPAYEALSYVWGPQIPSYRIQCSDRGLSIGVNLRDALVSLRKTECDRVLWIDRVAINQADVDERTQQVGLMADIYSCASLVVIWLGKPDSRAKEAIDIIHDLDLQMFRTWKGQMSELAGDATANAITVQYPSSEDAVWQAVRSLLENPWFSRMWTFQEIVLASQALFYCGPYTLSWAKLRVFIGGLYIYSQGPNVEHSTLRGAEREAAAIIKARGRFHESESPSPQQSYSGGSLLSLLNDLRHRNATDPRDKIFALLNVAYDTRNSDLTADYRKSPAEVYASTMKWLLRTHRNLAFLSLVEKKDKPDLLSWVPDFRYKDDMNFMHTPAELDRKGSHIYRASGSSKAVVTEEEPLFHLTVRGIHVGTIVGKTDPPGNLTGNVAIGAKVLDGGQWHLFARTCAQDGKYSPTGEPIDLAYHRIRIWDSLPNEGLSRRERSIPLTEIPQPGSISYDYAKDARIHGRKDDIGTRIISCTTRKRLFKTDTGLLGIAHRSIEVGDEVFVLMGADMPVVLRPMGIPYFGFGGEAYVHGIMDGEALARAWAKSDDSSVRDVTDLAWTTELDDEPWPFTTREIVLV